MTRASLSGLAFLIDLSQEGDLPGGGRRPPSAARLRRLRATLENGLRRFLSSAPSRVRIHARATKKRAVRARFSYQPGGERGIRRAAGAALDPLRACGACGLRWKTLARFLSSAPSRVRIHARATEKAGRSGPLLISTWRRERDSNPRNTCVLNGFQDRRIQPLCHLSGVLGNDSIERDVTCAGFARAVREVRGCRDEASR